MNQRVGDGVKGLVVGVLLAAIVLSGFGVGTANPWMSNEDRLDRLESETEDLERRVEILERSNTAWAGYVLKSQGDEFGGEISNTREMWIDIYYDVQDQSDCVTFNPPISQKYLLTNVEPDEFALFPFAYTIIESEWLGSDGDLNCVWTLFAPSVPISESYTLQSYRDKFVPTGFGWSWSEDDLDEYRTIRLIFD